MNAPNMYQWLLEHGGPVIRYRTAAEFMSPSDKIDTYRLLDELLQSMQVKIWLERLVPHPSITNSNDTEKRHYLLMGGLHGAKEDTFENIMGKLTDFGLRKGVPEFDKRTEPFREWLQDNVERPPRFVFDVFIKTLIAAFLAEAGYSDEPAVKKILMERLETVYDFTRQGSYDIYVNPEGYRKMPAGFRNRPLINPKLTRDGKDGNFCFPTIYDIIGWAAYLSAVGTNDEWDKANTIIRYIFNERYQELPWGYGAMLGGNGRYYAMGWSIHLARFKDRVMQGTPKTAIVFLLNQLTRFSAASGHPWFKDMLDNLEGFRTEKGTYLFPRDYLQDKPLGCWVLGCRLGLEENRKTNLSRELESTFWMARLRKVPAI